MFVSYAHEDRKWCERLEAHLGWLVHSQQVCAFEDSQIGAGAEWPETIRQELAAADIIILIVSADFMASRYCTTVELREAMTKQGAGSARIVPIIADHCDWAALPISTLQALPQDERYDLKPLVDWPNPNVPIASIAASGGC